MIEHTLTTQQMNAAKALADVSMKISEARGILFKIQQSETEYLKKREEKALEMIEQTLKASDEFIEKAKSRYQELEDFSKEITMFAENLSKTFDTFEGFVTDFNQRSVAWENKIKRQQEDIAELKREILRDSVKIINSKKSLVSKEESLRDLASHIESRQTTLQKTYEIEKNLWNKIK